MMKTIYQEVQLYSRLHLRLPCVERQSQNIIKDNNASNLTVSRDFFVIAKIGEKS